MSLLASLLLAFVIDERDGQLPTSAKAQIITKLGEASTGRRERRRAKLIVRGLYIDQWEATERVAMDSSTTFYLSALDSSSWSMPLKPTQLSAVCPGLGGAIVETRPTRN